MLMLLSYWGRGTMRGEGMQSYKDSPLDVEVNV